MVDVNPENVFLSNTNTSSAYPRVVLGDFGNSYLKSEFNDIQSDIRGDNLFASPDEAHTSKSNIY